MEFQQFVPGIPYAAAVLAVGIFLWRVFVRTLAGMEARFDDRFSQVDKQFAQMETRFDDRLVQMESRFDDRFSQVDRQFAQMESRFNDRFVQMETRFDDRFVQVDKQLAQMDGRFASLDKKVDGLAADHHRLSRELSEFRGEVRARLSMLVPQADADT